MYNLSILFEEQACLEEIFPVFNEISTDSVQLKSLITRTNGTAQQISSKVRLLDMEYSNLTQTISLIDTIGRLKTDAIAVKAAMELKQYSEAAEYIHNYLQTDKRIIDLYATERSGSHYLSDKTSPIDHFICAQKELQEIVVSEFDDAVIKSDKERMKVFLKLFAKIGATEVGMDRYFLYLCNLVATQAQEGLKQDPNQIKRLHVKLFNDVSESVALIVDQQELLVEGCFGDGSSKTMIKRLNREADNQICIILSSFNDFYQLSRRIHDIKKSYSLEVVEENTLLETRILDNILGDVAFFCQKNKFFRKFIAFRSSSDSEDTDERVKKEIDELITAFITVQEYYIKKSVEKALEIDEREPTAILSSCVDDVFFIMKNAAKRSLSSFNVLLFTSTLSSICLVLDQVFMSFLTSQLQEASGTCESKEGRSKFIVFLNNLDSSCDNIQILSNYLNKEASQLWKNEPETTFIKVNSSISSLNEEASSFKNISKSWNENLFIQVLRPRLKPILMQAFGGDIKYILSTDEYADMQANQFFLNRFMTAFNKLMGFYKRTLTAHNYNHIFTFVIDYIFKEWETYILSLRFNLLGATRFDEDLRAVCAFLATMTTLGFRERFARLSQISTVLNLDSVMEIYEYWGSRRGSLAWKLSANEVKKILLLRTEFHPEEINKLNL